MFVVLFLWIHLESGQRYVLGVVCNCLSSAQNFGSLSGHKHNDLKIAFRKSLMPVTMVAACHYLYSSVGGIKLL